jgi:hypothetical protein
MPVSRLAMHELKRWVTNVAANGPSNVEFLRGLKRDLPREATNRADREAQIYTNEKPTIAAFTKISEFMADRLGRAIAKSGHVMFQAQENLDAFNRHVQKFQTPGTKRSRAAKTLPGSPAEALMNLDKMHEFGSLIGRLEAPLNESEK